MIGEAATSITMDGALFERGRLVPPVPDAMEHGAELVGHEIPRTVG